MNYETLKLKRYTFFLYFYNYIKTNKQQQEKLLKILMEALYNLELAS